MPLNDYSKYSNFYKSTLEGTGYLAFRDLPFILKKYPNLYRVLDFGCGAGRSSDMLYRLGLGVNGVDINPDMIKLASKLQHPSINFDLMLNNRIPFTNNSFEIVFNSFVLFDIRSKKDLKLTFKEMKRVCKKNGLIISIVNSDFLFQKKWLTVDNNYPQNKALKSGDIAKIRLTDVNVELYDYFWKEEDYIEAMECCNLEVVYVHKPLGYSSDGYPWIDEFYFPPYTIFVCSVNF